MYSKILFSGTYALDCTTNCGDIIDLNLETDFRVKRVRFIYKYTRDGLRVVSKKLDVVVIQKRNWLKDTNVLQ